MDKIFLILLALSSACHATQVYKCTDQSGKTAYQDTPCVKQKQQVLDQLPSNSIKGPSVASKTSSIATATPTPQASAAPTPTPTQRKVDTNLSATENCSVDNPNRDREFCRASNLNNVYGNPTLTRPLPRPLPAKR